jgi:hypothetical protein
VEGWGGRAFVTQRAVDVSTEKILAVPLALGSELDPRLALAGAIELGGSPERFEGNITL